MLRKCIAIGCLCVAACAELPDVAEPIPSSGVEPDYPELVNLNTLELTADEDEEEALESEATVAARVSNLNAKAAALRAAEPN